MALYEIWGMHGKWRKLQSKLESCPKDDCYCGGSFKKTVFLMEEVDTGKVVESDRMHVYPMVETVIPSEDYL